VSLINTCSVEADWVQGLPGNVTQNFNLVLELFPDKFITNVASKIDVNEEGITRFFNAPVVTVEKGRRSLGLRQGGGFPFKESSRRCMV